ncbi:hypothetical protein AAFF_G00388790 [Aldrovandia affinis]|uniref:Uncharacterized protein n=1 Tax=Aldrovandia affinis TaxID=143900 RepID=A0AAD7R498_9TELE|nr:hypothetical protein AAFF_G00388790 [Aldrovandia affinis]
MGFSEQQLAERLKKFKFFKLQQHLRDLKSHPAQGTLDEPGAEHVDTAVKVLRVEQEIDRLNEVFLQLSVELQGRAEKRTGLEDSVPAQGAVESCLSRHATLLLELKRRCVAQRLGEMQAQLAQISMQQQHSQKPDRREPDSQGPESQETDRQGPERDQRDRGQTGRD